MCARFVGLPQACAIEGADWSHAGGVGVSALRQLANGFGDGSTKALASQDPAQDPPASRADAASAARSATASSDTRAGLSREMDAAAAEVERARGALRPVRIA